MIRCRRPGGRMQKKRVGTGKDGRNEAKQRLVVGHFEKKAQRTQE